MDNKICTVTMIKASLQDTLSFVNYHLNIGINHVFLLLDDPKDEAFNVLKDRKNVTCFKGDDNHWKKLTSDSKLKPILKEMKKGQTFAGSKSTKLAKTKSKNKLARVEKQELYASYIFNFAKENGYDWVCHLDSDELIYVEKESLKSMLAKTPKDIDTIRLTALEAVPENLSPKNIFTDTTLFKSIGGISRFYYKHKRLLQKLIPLVKKKEGNISGVFFNGHAAGKSMIRTSAPIKMVGIHEPVGRQGEKLKFGFPKNGFLLHFDSCSFDEWKLKCVRKYDGTVVAIAMKKKGFEIFEKFVEAYKKGDKEGMRKVYIDKFFIPRFRKIVFRGLGLLKRIRLNKKLFEKK